MAFTEKKLNVVKSKIFLAFPRSDCLDVTVEARQSFELRQVNILSPSSFGY